MKVLVTGASGFVGLRLVERLLEEGHFVRALYRRIRPPAKLVALRDVFPTRLHLHRMDLAFPKSMPNLRKPSLRSWIREAHLGVPAGGRVWPWHPRDLERAAHLLGGMDACVHIAAKVGDWGSLASFFSANVNVTGLLLEAARRMNLGRFVYVSSVSVHGFGDSRENGEDGSYFPSGNPYPVSKRLAESLVERQVRKGLDAIILRPGTVYGPGDTTTFYPIFDSRLLPLLAGGRSLTCPVYIDDFVDATVGALEVENPAKRRFNITSGEVIRWKEVLATAQGALALPCRLLRVPSLLAYALAPLGEALYKLIGSRSRPVLTWYVATQLLHDYSFRIDDARKVLGYRPAVMTGEGMSRMAAAYRRDRGLRPDLAHAR